MQELNVPSVLLPVEEGRNHFCLAIASLPQNFRLFDYNYNSDDAEIIIDIEIDNNKKTIKADVEDPPPIIESLTVASLSEVYPDASS